MCITNLHTPKYSLQISKFILFNIKKEKLKSPKAEIVEEIEIDAYICIEFQDEFPLVAGIESTAT